MDIFPLPRCGSFFIPLPRCGSFFIPLPLAGHSSFLSRVAGEVSLAKQVTERGFGSSEKGAHFAGCAKPLSVFRVLRREIHLSRFSGEESHMRLPSPQGGGKRWVNSCDDWYKSGSSNCSALLCSGIHLKSWVNLKIRDTSWGSGLHCRHSAR